MSDGRFTLSLGSGEKPNKHVVSRGWPAVDIRHEMLAESVEAIRARWNGDYVTNRRKHITVENARILSMLDETPGLAVAVNGEQSIESPSSTRRT